MYTWIAVESLVTLFCFSIIYRPFATGVQGILVATCVCLTTEFEKIRYFAVRAFLLFNRMPDLATTR